MPPFFVAYRQFLYHPIAISPTSGASLYESGLCCASGYVIGPVDYDGVFKNYACYKASEVPSAVSCNVIWKSDGDFTPATSEQCEDVTDFSVAMRDVNYCPNGMSGWKKRTLAGFAKKVSLQILSASSNLS